MAVDMKRSTNTAPVSLSTSYLIGSPRIGISMITLQSFGTSLPAGTRSRFIGRRDALERGGDYTGARSSHGIIGAKMSARAHPLERDPSRGVPRPSLTSRIGVPRAGLAARILVRLAWCGLAAIYSGLLAQ